MGGRETGFVSWATGSGRHSLVALSCGRWLRQAPANALGGRWGGFCRTRSPGYLTGSASLGKRLFWGQDKENS